MDFLAEQITWDEQVIGLEELQDVMITLTIGLTNLKRDGYLLELVEMREKKIYAQNKTNHKNTITK